MMIFAKRNNNNNKETLIYNGEVRYFVNDKFIMGVFHNFPLL